MSRMVLPAAIVFLISVVFTISQSVLAASSGTENNLLLNVNETASVMLGKKLVSIPSKDVGSADVFLAGKEASWPFNKIFSLVVRSENKSAELMLQEIEIRMPEHGHGMVVKPKIEKVGPGTFEVQGVKLHMRGNWSINLSWKAGKKVSKSTTVNFSI